MIPLLPLPVGDWHIQMTGFGSSLLMWHLVKNFALALDAM